jgi:uncharacterized protein (TIGR01244 family)
MDNTMKINEQITVGPQPNRDEIYEFGREGFKTIVNFRAANEDGMPLTPQAEGEAVKSAGMQYCHIPVPMSLLDDQQVDEFREQFDALPKPIFAHCKSGKRAGAMVMLETALEQGMSGDQTLEKAQELGFQCDKPELKNFVKRYVDTHNK